MKAPEDKNMSEEADVAKASQDATAEANSGWKNAGYFSRNNEATLGNVKTIVACGGLIGKSTACKKSSPLMA